MEYGQFAVAAGSELEGVTMSFGKMNTLVDIVQTAPVKDAEGFVSNGDVVLATIRAYREEKHGNESWANRAVFFHGQRIVSVSQVSQLYRHDQYGTDL